MGQKVNPHGLRVGVIKMGLKMVLSDKKIRKLIIRRP